MFPVQDKRRGRTNVELGLKIGNMAEPDVNRFTMFEARQSVAEIVPRGAKEDSAERDAAQQGLQF